jgi:hypothetical protein
VVDGRLGVPLPLDDYALGLIVVEVGVVLQRSGVLGPHDLHRLSGQALELVELAFVELEPSDTQKLTHPLPPPDFALLGEIDTLGWPSERPRIMITRTAEGQSPGRDAERTGKFWSCAAAPSPREPRRSPPCNEPADRIPNETTSRCVGWSQR